MIIDISKKSKAAVLAALYNHAKPVNLKVLNFVDVPMSEEKASHYLENGQFYFDYLNGRTMKVDLTTNDFETMLYDHNNGEGTAQKAVDTCPDIR